jgi:hypothetical protein
MPLGLATEIYLLGIGTTSDEELLDVAFSLKSPLKRRGHCFSSKSDAVPYQV